jgi:hypothetical protein
LLAVPELIAETRLHRLSPRMLTRTSTAQAD